MPFVVIVIRSRVQFFFEVVLHLICGEKKEGEWEFCRLSIGSRLKFCQGPKFLGLCMHACAS
jgi:hypothetical protein